VLPTTSSFWTQDASLCHLHGFDSLVAQAVLSVGFILEGKKDRVMAHPEGFR